MDIPIVFARNVPTIGLGLASKSVGCSPARGYGATTSVWPRGPTGGKRSHAGHGEEDNITSSVIKRLAMNTRASRSTKKPGSASSSEAALLPSSHSGSSSTSGDSSRGPEGDWTNHGEVVMGTFKLPRLGPHTPKPRGGDVAGLLPEMVHGGGVASMRVSPCIVCRRNWATCPPPWRGHRTATKHDVHQHDQQLTHAPSRMNSCTESGAHIAGIGTLPWSTPFTNG